VKTTRGNEEGKEFITGIHKAGDFIGYISLIEDKPYSDSAETLENAELVIIPKEDFIKIFNSNRQVSAKFIKLLAANVIASEEKLLKLAYDSVRGRVAQALIEMVQSHNLAAGQHPVISISREDLGNMAGTATESAIRALKDFKDEGLIDIKASHITVLNYQKLKNVKW
jgi:CRP-like cAMP-binding protein